MCLQRLLMARRTAGGQGKEGTDNDPPFLLALHVGNAENAIRQLHS